MKIKKYSKEGLQFIEITNSIGFKVTLVDLGASIYSIYLNEKPMTMSLVNPSDFKVLGNYHGKTIGSIDNRIKEGKVTINSKTYQMSINETPNTLHGGNEGISSQYFDSEIEQTDDEVIVTYHFFKKNMLDGLPGNINYDVIYKIKDISNELTLQLNALSDQDTVLALTNHSFYCLGSKSLNDLYLTIKSNKYVYTGSKDLLPLSYKPVKNSILDFNNKKLIIQDIDNPEIYDHRTKGYDHNFIFENIDITLPNVILENSKYKLSFYSDCESVQIYTDNYPGDSEFISSKLKVRRSIAIELQDSILDRRLVKAKEKYSRTTKLVFETK